MLPTDGRLIGWCASLLVALALLAQAPRPEARQAASVVPASTDPAALQADVARYCAGCHNGRLNTGGLSLDGLDVADVAAKPETWEKVVRKLRGRMMPPAGAPSP